MSKEEKKTYTIKSDENLGEVKIADEVSQDLQLWK